MAQVKIGTPYPAPSITQDRFGKRDMVIPYWVDGEGAFDVRMPLEDYTADKAQQLVTAQARSQIQLKGKELTI
jgi:hypothetical protein